LVSGSRKAQFKEEKRALRPFGGEGSRLILTVEWSHFIRINIGKENLKTKAQKRGHPSKKINRKLLRGRGVADIKGHLRKGLSGIEKKMMCINRGLGAALFSRSKSTLAGTSDRKEGRGVGSIESM